MDEAAAEPDHYFLSYSRSDEAFALRLAKDLRAEGIRLWVDQLDIRPSEHWDRAIERAVRDCRGILVIVSPRSIASDNVADEISYAINAGKSVLPVMIERCDLPLRITRMQVIDATANYRKALQQCSAELRRSDRASAVRDTGRAHLEPQVVDLAKRRLATVLGPIAGVLTDKAAGRATSEHELYRLLSLHIEDEAHREQFLRPVQQVTSSGSPAPVAAEAEKKAIGLSDLESAGRILARYVGPIALTLAKREANSCESMEELAQRLAGTIPTAAERNEFLRQLLAK